MSGLWNPLGFVFNASLLSIMRWVSSHQPRCLIATFYNVRKLTPTVHTFQDAIHHRGWINGELQQNWQQLPSSSPPDRELPKQNRLWPQTSVKTGEPENNKLLLPVLQCWCKDDFTCTGFAFDLNLNAFQIVRIVFFWFWQCLNICESCCDCCWKTQSANLQNNVSHIKMSSECHKNGLIYSDV